MLCRGLQGSAVFHASRLRVAFKTNERGASPAPRLPSAPTAEVDDADDGDDMEEEVDDAEELP